MEYNDENCGVLLMYLFRVYLSNLKRLNFGEMIIPKKQNWLTIFKSHLVLLLFLINNPLCFKAQTAHPITHTSGTSFVFNTNVTVTSFGKADTLSNYCTYNTKPYFIGYSFQSPTGCCGDGGYTFDFSPPIDALTLNIGGITNIWIGRETVTLKVNGSHYRVTEIGEHNCDTLAIITPNGDITSPDGWDLAGWNGTHITGPISSITVFDSMYFGNAAGSVFSIFICDGTIDELKDTVLCNGEQLIINAPDSVSNWTWSDNSNNSSYVVNHGGYYWGQMKDGFCRFRDSFYVKMKECVASIIEMPTVFTPNNDGINDVFFPIVYENTLISDLYIYDRWGKRMKYISDATKGWDGKTNNGQTCSDGTYYWVIECINEANEKARFKGFVQVFGK